MNGKRMTATLILGIAISAAVAVASANAATMTATATGLYQVERSNTATGYEVIYYPAGHAPNATLRYPGSPRPSATRPTWKPSKHKMMEGRTVSVNTATVEQLMMVPGIGEATARHIVEARPYASVDDVVKAKGVKAARLATFRMYLTK